MHNIRSSLTAVLRIDGVGKGQNQGHQFKDVSVVMQVTENSGLLIEGQ